MEIKSFQINDFTETSKLTDAKARVTQLELLELWRQLASMFQWNVFIWDRPNSVFSCCSL